MNFIINRDRSKNYTNKNSTFVYKIYYKIDKIDIKQMILLLKKN